MPTPETNQNKAENLQEQPKPKLDRIDAKLDGADANGGAKDIGETGVTDAENVSKQEKGTLVKLKGFTKEQFAALQKRGTTLPKISGLPDAAQPNVDDLKTGTKAVTSTELIQGARDATKKAREGVKKTVHTMKGGTIEDLKKAVQVAGGATVDTVRAGVDPAATKAAGAIGEKKGRDAAPNVPIFGDALKDKAGAMGKKAGEQAARSTLDAFAARAKDAIQKPIDNAQDILKNRSPEKAREGVERTPQQELRELIGKHHHSKNEKVQKDFDALFVNLPPERAKAMIDVYKTMNPQQQQRFMEKMHTDADVFAKMTPQGREQCARLLGATPKEREQMILSLPKGDLAKVRNLYVNDREGWNMMTEFYNKTDTQQQQGESAVAQTQMQDVLQGAFGKFGEMVGNFSPDFARQSVRIMQTFDPKTYVEAFQKTLKQLNISGGKAREIVEAVAAKLPEQSSMGRIEQSMQSLRSHLEDGVVRALRAALMQNPEMRAKLEKAERAKRAIAGGPEGKGDRTAIKSFADEYLKSQDATWYEKVYANLDKEGFDAKVQERITKEYRNEIEETAKTYGVSPEFIEKIVIGNQEGMKKRVA